MKQPGIIAATEHLQPVPEASFPHSPRATMFVTRTVEILPGPPRRVTFAVAREKRMHEQFSVTVRKAKGVGVTEIFCAWFGVPVLINAGRHLLRAAARISESRDLC